MPKTAIPVASSRALLRRLWMEYVRRHTASIALAIFCTIVVSGLTALYPVVIQQASNLFTQGDDRIIWLIPPVIVVVTALKSLAQYGQAIAIASVVLRVVEGLQVDLFHKLTHADLAVISRDAPARHASRFTTDAGAIREALAKSINSVADALSLIGLVGSMIWLDWQLSLIAAVLYPIAIVPVLKLGKRIRRASGTAQDRVGDTATHLVESFGAAQVVRAYRLEAQEEQRAERTFAALRASLMTISRARSRLDPMLEALGGVAVAAILAFVGWRVAAGHGTVGDFTGFVAALLIAARPLRALGSLNAALQEGLAGLTRVFAVMDTPRRIQDPPGAPALPEGPGRIEFRSVAFSYGVETLEDSAALRGLDLVAEPGQTIALVGPSGAGKSTALALVPRFYDVTGGAVVIDGADVRAVSVASLRDAIAYVGQDAILFDDTVRANIACGRPGASDEEVVAAARASQAHAFIMALPQGYETVLGTGGNRLSGGQRQRLTLARALLRNARILLLDEATSALDAENEALVQQALLTLRKGRTTLVIAHRLATVRDADCILVLEAGRMVERGTHAELMAAGGLYARLVQTQTFSARE